MSGEAAARFGDFQPGPLKAWARNRALRLRKRDWCGRQLSSLYLRLAGGKLRGECYDVDVFESQRARLHPSDNICEKRVYCTPQFWDALEREKLASVIAAHTDGEFSFVDIGANAGLYTLFALSAAKASGVALKYVAVEPEPTMRARLEYNLHASRAAGGIVLPWAVTPKREQVALYPNQKNRGETSLNGQGESISVEGRPLTDVFGAADFSRVDAMKIDIEGAEHPALSQMFEDAPETLWPRLLLLEVRHDGEKDSTLELCLDSGYEIVLATKMNAVLRRAA